MAGVPDSNRGMPVSKPVPLPLGDTPMTVAVNRYIEEKMAGVPGFEPGNAGIKTGALPLGDTPSVQRLRVNGAGGET